MLLLHTADLHLGKALHERDMIQDQSFMLDRLLGLIAERRPAAILVAGDLYDRSIPQPEALGLFDSFLCRAVEADPELVVIVITGNHDSAARLSFGTALMRRARVHIVTRAEDSLRPIYVERGGEKLAVWALPFLNPGAFPGSPASDAVSPEFPGAASATGAAPGLRSQAELFAEAMRRIEPLLDPVSPNVLLAHCFAAGGVTSESERSFVGSSEQVDAAPFDRFDYVALGHLHRCQSPGRIARYSGSPLAYSFAEGGQEKGVLLAEVARGRMQVDFLALEPLRALRRLEGTFAELSAPGARNECRNDFIEVRLSDLQPVMSPADPLRANFPNLLSVRQAAFEPAASGPASRADAPGATAGADATADDGVAQRDRQGAGAVIEDFLAFHAEILGRQADGGTMSLFTDLLREADDASR